MIAVAQSFFAPSSVARGAFGSIASEKTPALEQTSSAIRPSFDKKCLCTVASGSLYTCRASSGSRIAPAWPYEYAGRMRSSSATSFVAAASRNCRLTNSPFTERTFASHHDGGSRSPSAEHLTSTIVSVFRSAARIGAECTGTWRIVESGSHVCSWSKPVFDSNWISALPLPSSTSRSAAR